MPAQLRAPKIPMWISAISSRAWITISDWNSVRSISPRSKRAASWRGVSNNVGEYVMDLR